jgi:glycosyltransferase 2 family protein
VPGYAKWLLKAVFTIAILCAIVAKVDFRQIFETLQLITPVSILVGLLLAFLQSGVLALRLSLMIELYQRRIPLWDSVRVTLESAFFSQTFVSFLGGDALRVWRIRRCGLPLSQAASAIVLDRLIGVTVNHIFLLAALPWLLAEISDHAIRVGLIVLAAAGVAGFAFMLILGACYREAGEVGRFPDRIRTTTMGRLALELAGVGRHFLHPGPKLLSAALASLVVTLINSLIFFVLLSGWGMTTGAALGCALLTPAVMEIAMLPISIAGWGVREGVAIIAFSGFGVPSTVALGSSLLFGLIVLTVGLVGGILWLVDHREIGTLAAIEAEVIASKDAAATPNAG